MQQQNQPLSPLEVDSGWLASYQQTRGFFDEWKSSKGAVAMHWDEFFRKLDRLGESDYRQREDQLERMIAENGITYNVYSDPENTNRLWKMDAIPLLLDQAEFDEIERAQSQRSRLLNLILEDIYGDQVLLKENLYPVGLVFGNPTFLRPVHGLLPKGRQFLHNYSSDLARSPDGNWWCLTDRLDAPSGLGYSIENRVISTRVMADLMAGHPVRRLASYLGHFADALKQASPRTVENPFVVLLTPGSYNETYFEQSYLARTLGFPLVEGADLTVRDDRVYLKTIHGMKRVDVIFRRLDSEWCDPLEFRSDSLLGVPGLINAIRQDQVSVVNAPGVGVLETPALAAFLPLICPRLLGEDLLMPSIATWWCGQKNERQYVLDNLEHLVIKPTFPSLNQKSYFGPSLTKKALSELKEKIRSHPDEFTAQEMVKQATTPVYDDESTSLVPRHFMVRTFQVSGDESRPFTMPGGLCRVAHSAISPDVSMQVGGISKDVWVIGDSDAHKEQALVQQFFAKQSLSIGSKTPLSSRLADSLYWVGRYFDRADGMIRGILVIINALREIRNEDDLENVLRFVEGFSPNLNLEQIRASMKPEVGVTEVVEQALRQIIAGPSFPDRLTHVLSELGRVTFSVKELISADLPRLLRSMPIDELPKLCEGRLIGDQEVYVVLTQLQDSMAAFAGIIAENTVRGHDWVFINLGRRIERSMNLSVILRSCLEAPVSSEGFLLWNLLEYTDSAVTYRRRFLTRMRVDAVCQLIIIDPTNPRSLAFQFEEILNSVRLLPHYDPSNNTAIDRLALKAYSDTVILEPSELYLVEDGYRPNVRSFLRDSYDHLIRLSNELSHYYFSFVSRGL
ncbi:MAG: circularly permuted type 2 ATP-grasp protein [Verrucomicrobiota bacterium]